MRITLDYDPDTGDISHRGVQIMCWPNLQEAEEKTCQTTPVSTSELATLKEAGFGVFDIIAMKKEGLV